MQGYFKVYEMCTGSEREEIKLMAVVTALYYTQWMLRAKNTVRLNSLLFKISIHI